MNTAGSSGGDPLNIESWMDLFLKELQIVFENRLVFVGLQGSRGRGEGRPDSDIDVVCILDTCSLQDLETYRAAVADLPNRDKLCGFVSGAAELAVGNIQKGLSSFVGRQVILLRWAPQDGQSRQSNGYLLDTTIRFARCWIQRQTSCSPRKNDRIQAPAAGQGAVRRRHRAWGFWMSGACRRANGQQPEEIPGQPFLRRKDERTSCHRGYFQNNRKEKTAQ